MQRRANSPSERIVVTLQPIEVAGAIARLGNLNK